MNRFGGGTAHLAVDFDRPDRPAVVADVLASCAEGPAGKPIDPELWWDITVGRRIEFLVVLAGWEGGGSIPIRLVCTSCREPMEFSFTVDELLALVGPADEDEVPAALGDRLLTMRRPTGADQRAWLGRAYPDPGSAVRDMVSTLMVDGPDHLSDVDLATIEAAMEEADPLVNLRVSTRCPTCDEQASREIDLTAVSLDILSAAQSRLLASVHRLASRYHWTESQILELPAWRRDRYLALIAGEEPGA